jgi:hypothetical protein
MKSSERWSSEDVEFNENDFGDKDEMMTTTTKSQDQTTEDLKEETVEFEEEKVGEEVTTEPRTSGRTRKAPVRYGYDEYAETAIPVYPPRHIV